jgi:hypothetical protein
MQANVRALALNVGFFYHRHPNALPDLGIMRLMVICAVKIYR